jgi:hypothetical protein
LPGASRYTHPGQSALRLPAEAVFCTARNIQLRCLRWKPAGYPSPAR